MNTNNVVSQVVAADLSGKEHLLVKLTSTGINIAASTDRIIGTLMRGNVKKESGSAVGLACDVFLTGGFLHYAVLGATSAAIAMGAGLIPDPDNNGHMIPSESDPIAIAWQAITGAHGSVLRALFLV